MRVMNIGAKNNEDDLLRRRLLRAASCDSVQDVSHLVANFTADVNTLSMVLNNACEKGNLSVVQWIVENTVLGGNVAVLSEGLTSASRRGQLDVVTWLVEHTTLQEHTKHAKELGRALVLASRYTQWDVLTWLIDNTQPDVDCVDYSNNTALHNVIWRDIYDLNLLLEYSRYGDMAEVCTLAFTYRHNVNLQDNYYSDTPLHEACRSGYSDIVGALLLAGADETITNDRQETPAQELSTWTHASVQVLELLDVSSEWKMLVRAQRLRRRTSVRVMMALVKRKVE